MQLQNDLVDYGGSAVFFFLTRMKSHMHEDGEVEEYALVEPEKGKKNGDPYCSRRFCCF